MSWRFEVLRVHPTQEDKEVTSLLLEELLGGRKALPVSALFESGSLLAGELPRALRAAFKTFKTEEHFHALCVENDPPSDDEIGATPLFHRPGAQEERASVYDALHFLYSCLLGQPFAWSSIQNGYIFNDVMPVPEHEALPASSGFRSPFGLHTEDAFHAYAGDYLGLLCLRNPSSVNTVFAGFDVDEISEKFLESLFAPEFVVGANVAQLVEEITGLSPVLFGSQSHPYMRLNMNSLDAAPGRTEASAALAEFERVLLRNVTRVAFQPGEYWYIDNYRVAHGRDAYTPRLDGTDRWLRRLYITSSFRRSIALRHEPANCVIDPTESEVKWCW